MADVLVERMPNTGIENQKDISEDLANDGQDEVAVVTGIGTGTQGQRPFKVNVVQTSTSTPIKVIGNPILTTKTYNFASQENVQPRDVNVVTGRGLIVDRVTLEDLAIMEENQVQAAAAKDEGPRARVITGNRNRARDGIVIPLPIAVYGNQPRVLTADDNLNNNIIVVPANAHMTGNVGSGGVPPDDNNNNGDGNGDSTNSENPFWAGIKSLPPVSTFISLIMIILYFLAGYIVDTEEDINICWSKVVGEGQVWRLLVAHFFHFGRLHILANVITLMAMGRYLEKKINKTAMALLILSMGVLSNVLYLFIGKYIAGEEPDEMSTYGFAHIHYGLRVVLALVQEEVVHRTLIFGVLPVAMSTTWAPWQPLLEVFLLKLIMKEMPISGPISGILSGFILSYFLRRFKPRAFGREVVPYQSTSRLNTSAWTRRRGRRH